MLIMTNPMPAKDKLDTCRSQILSITESALNAASMVTAQKNTYFEIRQDQDLYHWCFFNAVFLLDEKLTYDNMKMSYEVKNRHFLTEMKMLWVLARALDELADSKDYFFYIRKRYVGMSREYFARDVDVLVPPFGRYYKAYEKPIPKVDEKKPAASFEEDL